MVPITEDWIKSLLELGECLNSTALRHNLDILEFKMEPEFGYVCIKGTRDGDVVMSAVNYSVLDKTDIKIAPQGASFPAGQKQHNYKVNYITEGES